MTKRGFKFQIEKITSEVNGISTKKTIYPEENYFKKIIFKEYFDNTTRLNISYKYKNSKNLLNVFLTVPEKINLKVEEGSDLDRYFKIEGIRTEDVGKEYFQMYLNGDLIMQHSVYSYKEDILNFPLVCFNDTPLGEETIKLYNKLSAKEEDLLLNALKIIDENIENIKFKDEYEDIKKVFLLKKQEEFIPLNYMGDGFKRIFYIVLKMLSLRGKRILIDEIEIGVHYSKMKHFWVNIFKVCKELDVQLFATTHSEECIEAYVEASKETNEKDIRLIRLQENKDKSIKAICYPFETVEYFVESNTEER